MVRTISKGIKNDLVHSGCGECQTSCQSACKTSCTVANQKCENEKRTKTHNEAEKNGGGTLW